MTDDEPRYRVDRPEGWSAKSPREIPWRGWQQVILRVYARVNQTDLVGISAGVAFFALLAIPPAFGAFIALYSVAADPSTILDHAQSFRGVWPQDTLELATRELTRMANSADGRLTIGALFSLLISVWSAKRGTQAVLIALNTAYKEEEARSMWRRMALSYLFTGATVIAGTLALGVISLLPGAMRILYFGPGMQAIVAFARWPVLGIGISSYLVILYAYGPHRRAPKLRWSVPGALFSTITWLLLSAGLSRYVARFGRYHEVYGSMGAVAITMLWLQLSTLVILVGAMLNAELEHQTAVDSTIGPSRPMGARGAKVADEALADPGPQESTTPPA